MINCTFENGNKAGLRHAVVDALILKDNQVLMIKRSNKIIEGNKWALVGGFVDRDETLEHAITREIKEESGYTVTNVQLFWVNDNPNRPNEDGRQNISFVFTCTALETTKKHDWEVDQVKWFPLDELPDEKTIAFDHGVMIQKYIASLNGKNISILDK